MLKYDLGVPDSQAPDKIATVTMTQSTLSLFWQFFIGAIFDTYGRKKPLLLSFFLLALEQFLIPFIHTWDWKILLTLQLPTLMVATSTCPLVPDLIDESSHGMANTLTIAGLDIGQVLASFEMTLNGMYPNALSGHNFYFINGILMSFCFVMIFLGIHDVILRKTNIPEAATTTSEKPKKFKFIVK